MLSTKSLKNLTLRERKKRMTHSRIVDCAGELFIAHGYQTTTVDAIAEGAEISKPTFFNYFSTKHAVLQSMVERMDAAQLFVTTRVADHDLVTAHNFSRRVV